MSSPQPHTQPRRWAALWAIIIGYFMILVDATIVSVAVPAISIALTADINSVIWVTSAYLLAYAVPLLITGRLGDRFGPKMLYQAGLAGFTIASLACSLSPTIGILITARAFQGLGAALMTPQTLTVITRLFPPALRGAAMAAWGASAGVATLVGPILGGLLIGSWGWEAIFAVNVPVGIVGFALTHRLLPSFSIPASAVNQKLDIVGIVLSAAGMLLLIFGIQEGNAYNWGRIVGPISVWMVIGCGVMILLVFIGWEAFQRGREPLMPLGLFRDRAFSLANIAITAIGFAITVFAFPIILWAQEVRQFTPTQSALLLLPMAVVTVVLSPIVGRNLNRWNPGWVAAGGIACFAAGLGWFAMLIGQNSEWPTLIAPSALVGIANGTVWATLSVTATQNLSPGQAGAGSGIFNATRQVGSVLGSAAIATLIDARLEAHLSQLDSAGVSSGPLMSEAHVPFSQAMGEALILPAAVLAIAFVAALGLTRPQASPAWRMQDTASTHGRLEQ